MKLLHVLCLTLVSASVALGSVASGYNSNGFEAPTFAPGPLDGQDGWTGLGTGGGAAPVVVTSPDPVLGQQAVRLQVGDTQGDSSSMDHAIAPVTPGPGVVVTVSYDIFRNAPAQGMLAQNMWWWWWDAGEPTYGLQWDQGGGLTLPHGWNPGAGSVPTIYGAWANLTMLWDFTQMKAYSWYNGVIVDNGISISGITELTGWTISLGHDAADGTGASTVWIDNFKIDVSVIPEPGSLAALATGLVGLGGLALRRRK